MESRSPALRQQSRSFNPEAASFNPTTPTIASSPTETSATRGAEKIFEIPGHSTFALSAAGASVQPGFASLFALANSKTLETLERGSMFKHSPFQTIGDVRSLPRREHKLAFTPFRVGDTFSIHAYPPAEDVEERPSVPAKPKCPAAPTKKVGASVMPVEARPLKDLKPSSSSGAVHAPTSTKKDPCTDPATLHELSAGLGLPAENTTKTSSQISLSIRGPPPGFEHLTKESRPSLLEPPGLEHLKNTYLPPYTYHPSSSPDYASLGSDIKSRTPPPSVKPSSRKVSSPPHGNNQPTQELYGKLIGRALDKPLTAKGLAQYLQLHGNSNTTNSGSDTSDTIVVGKTRQRSDTAETIRPSRSAFETHKIQSTIPSAEYVPGVSAPLLPKAIPSGPSAYQHRQRKSSDQSPADYQHHVRRPSNKRHRPRQNSRIKRMDQGPMPSSADIYPDDAWTPAPAPPYSTPIPPYIPTPAYAPGLLPNEPTAWPTPAEVYRAPTPHSTPTPADIAATHPEVHRLLAELPYPTMRTLTTLGMGQNIDLFTGLDLPCEPRPLTPGQADGSRYGLRFGGLGEGERWEFPAMSEGVQFRVRPRSHDGWGGVGWAVEMGWGVRVKEEK